MNKCDFCKEAILKSGVLTCPNRICVRPQVILDKIRAEYLEALNKANFKINSKSK